MVGKEIEIAIKRVDMPIFGKKILFFPLSLSVEFFSQYWRENGGSR